MLPNQKKALEAFRSSIKCVWCKEVLCNPATMPCGHHYCYDCSEDSLQKKHGCGICNHPFHRKDVSRDHKLHSIVEHVKKILEIAARAEEAEKKYFAQLEEKKRCKDVETSDVERPSEVEQMSPEVVPKEMHTGRMPSSPAHPIAEDEVIITDSPLKSPSATTDTPVRRANMEHRVHSQSQEDSNASKMDEDEPSNAIISQSVPRDKHGSTPTTLETSERQLETPQTSVGISSSYTSDSDISNVPSAHNVPITPPPMSMRTDSNAPASPRTVDTPVVAELETSREEEDIRDPIGHRSSVSGVRGGDIEEIREVPDEYSQLAPLDHGETVTGNDVVGVDGGDYHNTIAPGAIPETDVHATIDTNTSHISPSVTMQQSETMDTQDDIESLHSTYPETDSTIATHIQDDEPVGAIDMEPEAPVPVPATQNTHTAGTAIVTTSPSTINLSDTAIPRPRVLSGTNLSPDYTAKLSVLAERMGVRLVYDTLASGVTHLVAGAVLVPNTTKDASVEKYPATKRTIKYLFALLEGAWVITPEWVDACLESAAFVPEIPYEISGCLTHASRYFPKLARERALVQSVKPLAGLSISILPPLSRIKLEEAKQLIIRAGAEYCDDVQSPLDCSARALISLIHQNHIWITSFDPSCCDVERKQEYQSLSNYFVNPPIILDQMWLLESISSIKPAPYLAYGVRGRFFFNGFSLPQ